jgi:hypothetical protein
MIVNCTISGNNADDSGGGIIGYATVFNTIVWGNSPDQVAKLWDGPRAIVYYSDIQGGWTGEGTGNIDTDPLFTQAPDDGGDGFGDDPSTHHLDEGANDVHGDLRPLSGSPCIDAGDNSAVPFEITNDLAGNPRFVDDPHTPDTGNGDPPIVDMGAYEFQIPCPWDLNGDGIVTVLDLMELVMSFGPCDGCPADLNGDGVVNAMDLVALVQHFGPCP